MQFKSLSSTFSPSLVSDEFEFSPAATWPVELTAEEVLSVAGGLGPAGTWAESSCSEVEGPAGTW